MFISLLLLQFISCLIYTDLICAERKRKKKTKKQETHLRRMMARGKKAVNEAVGSLNIRQMAPHEQCRYSRVVTLID